MIPPALLDWFRSEDGFLLAAHVKPDGDALGSSLALCFALESLGKNAVPYDQDRVPPMFRFLPGWERVTSALPANAGDYTLVLLDCNEASRANLEEVRFRKSVVIDHHETASLFGDLRWIEPRYPATGLMVFELIKALGAGFTREMADNLYTAISTDTGNFRYDNTTPEALEASAELLRAGAKPARIAESVYETWSAERMKLLALALESLDIRDGTAVMTVSSEMFRQTGTSLEDTENFTNFPRMLTGVRVAAVFYETEPGEVKASIRSKGPVDVRLIAEKFGGGGHRNAAGYKIKDSLVNAKEEFFSAVREASKGRASQRRAS